MTVVYSKYDRKINELYETEAWATEALLRNIHVSGLTVWEPSSGGHKLADVLKKHGALVTTSDIESYQVSHDFKFDFLKDEFQPSHYNFDCLITNPPYGRGNRMAVKYVERALEVCSGKVAMLLTAKFDFGKTRQHLFKNNPRFFAKIALLDRIQWFPGEYGGTEDHAWYIWENRQHCYSPRMIWEQKI